MLALDVLESTRWTAPSPDCDGALSARSAGACRHFPGEIQKVLEWFRDYKIPDGKPANKFGYDNKCMNKEFTMHVIQETHEAYVKLKSGARANTEDLSLV